MGEEEQKKRRTAYDWIGRIAVWAAVIVGGWVFARRVVRTPAEHDPDTVLALIVVAVVLTWGLFWLQGVRSDRRAAAWGLAASKARLAWRDDHPDADWLHGYDEPERPDFGPNRWWLPPVIVVLVLVGLEWNLAHDLRNGEITDYCSYGTVSRAQLDECINHVSTDYIDKLDTNAARFAKAGEHECLEDAGPYSRERKHFIELEEGAE